MAIDVEFEISDLKRRVGELEGAFGFLMEQVKGVHRDLLGFQSQTREQFKDVRSEIRELRSETREEFKAVRKEIRQLREEMPGIVGDAMRDVLREKNGR